MDKEESVSKPFPEWWGRRVLPAASTELGNSNSVQYSCLEDSVDRGAWQATVHGVTRVGHDLATKPLPPKI